ncbi:MAG: SAV_2336 N-terminal domain-related protein, partial [Rhizonema sp. PD38]|nr:SAV_2336 N-terminal domain-related protein [Rhizonema sp. PD38]
MIRRLIARLEQAGLQLNAEEIADLLWLANQMKQAAPEPDQIEPPSEQAIQPSTPITSTSANAAQTPPLSPTPSKKQPTVSAYSSDTLPKSGSEEQSSSTPEGLPFKAPAAPALRNSLALARALRPLMRKVPSRTELVLDEEGTSRQIAEYQVWSPVLQPARERWLELVLVVEETRTTVVWEETIAEFQKLMERHGAFRNVYAWSLQTQTDGTPQLFPFQQEVQSKQRSRSPKELLDATGRRLILLISDCISPLWWQGEIHKLLELWGNHVPVAVLQLLPEQLWERTVLGVGSSVQLSAITPGVLNSQLIVSGLPIWQEEKPTMALKFPVVTLEPESLTKWARVVAGAGSIQTLGVLFEQNWRELLPKSSSPIPEQLTQPEFLVKRFYATASPLARKLVGFMAAAPVSLPVIHIIQQELLSESRQIHLAEIFMSGLLHFVQSHEPTQPKWQYKFVDGVREILLSSVRITEIDAVLEKVSQYIARKTGLQIKSFAALLSPNPNWDISTQQEVIPFATIAMQVLRQLGEDYAALAEQLERKSPVIEQVLEVYHNPPKILTFEFEVATTTLEAETETSPSIHLQPFEFEVATIELKQSGWLRRKTELTVKRHRQQATCFIEDLGNEVQLEMVAIPSGSFLMGSPEDEPERSNSESPQHRVTIQSFFISKYPVTQAQWQIVASLPQVDRYIKSNPSHFQGKNLPVEQVSWFHVIEFCARLSKYTGKPYRLPSEAEWE